ncbi:MAG: T9SS type A sorting domain-containing protein [Porphyromonas endodontalis]|jgi:hypothetical protein|uniref:T9SS type A sorting domain-containing protein n=1 Tax=Porphyromonas endodontalis TaxID=28124 RepID=UPI00360868DF
MTRKLLSSLLLLLALSYEVTAQQTVCKITQEPKALPAEACNFSIYGTSPNGRYIYGGSPNSTAFCYDTERDTTSLFLSETGAEKYMIYAVSDAGEIFVAQDEVGAYVCNMAQEKLHEIKTPESNWPDVRPVYVTPDAKFLVGYLMDPTYAQASMALPIYGTRGEDGSWTIKTLPMLDKDYLGNKPNYTQAFFCSPDGKKILGRQNTRNGSDRPLFWQLDEQGQYQCSTPCDSFIYNLDAPLPGPEPDWDDYVTADYEKDPDLYEKQKAKFNKDHNAWLEAYDKVVKGVAPDQAWQIMSPASGYWMISIQELIGEGDDYTTVSYPGALNVADGSIERINIKEAYGLGGLGRTHDGGWICYPDGRMDPNDRTTYVVYPDGRKLTILEYLKSVTGKDLSEFFTYSYTPYGETEQKSITDMGTIAISADGKTIAACAVDMTGTNYYRSAYLRIDKQFLAQPLGIAPIELQRDELSILWQGDALLFSEPATGTLYLYDTAGRLLDSYTLAAASRLSLTDLAQGLYIGQVVTERGVSTVRFIR